MFKPNLKLYAILIIILVVLFILVAIFPNSKRQEKTIQKPIIPTPTAFQFLPTPTIIHPTSTGGSEEVPQETLSFATQKQNLKKRTPLTQNGFTITFDYSNDVFIVTLSEPKNSNRETFDSWLKQTYPAIPITKFVFK